MSDDSIGEGHNHSNDDLKRRVDRRCELFGRAAELKAELDGMKAEDKDDGYTERALSHAVKMRLADPEKLLKALILDAEKLVYLEAAGVVTDIEAVSRMVRERAESMPQAKNKRGTA